MSEAEWMEESEGEDQANKEAYCVVDEPPPLLTPDQLNKLHEILKATHTVPQYPCSRMAMVELLRRTNGTHKQTATGSNPCQAPQESCAKT